LQFVATRQAEHFVEVVQERQGGDDAQMPVQPGLVHAGVAPQAIQGV